MSNAKRKPIHTTYSYYVVPENLSATPPQPMRVIRSNDTVSSAALLSLGCMRKGLVDTRKESAFKAQARIRAGRLDETERLIQFDSLDALCEHEHTALSEDDITELLLTIIFTHQELVGCPPAGVTIS